MKLKKSLKDLAVVILSVPFYLLISEYAGLRHYLGLIEGDIFHLLIFTIIYTVSYVGLILFIQFLLRKLYEMTFDADK